jgi:hypothetical protein
MAQAVETRTQRQATPERWQRALQRALFARVEAKQLAGSGEWIVGSASRPGIAYRTDGVSCDCEAAMLGGDPVCLHRAAYWYAVGVLDPEPEPPAPAAPVSCWQCNGCGQQWYRGGYALPCATCGGTGVAPLAAQAAALVAAATDATCDHCGRALDEDAETDAALQTLCGDCIVAGRENARRAYEAAVSEAHAQDAAERAALAA